MTESTSMGSINALFPKFQQYLGPCPAGVDPSCSPQWADTLNSYL